MHMAEFRHCPVQTNGYECGLFALAVVWHLLCDKDIHPSVFTQAHIDTFRVALRHGLSSNPGWATMDNIACYFPVLSIPAPPPPPSSPAIEISPPSFTSVGDAQLAGCGPRSLEVANVATERNTDAGPGMEFGPTEEPGQEQDPILDYEDNYFQDNFSSKGVVFGTVDDVLVAINEYQESSGTFYLPLGCVDVRVHFACELSICFDWRFFLIPVVKSAVFSIRPMRRIPFASLT